MKVSALIAYLETVRNVYGDIPVLWSRVPNGMSPSNPVETFQVDPKVRDVLGERVAVIVNP